MLALSLLLLLQASAPAAPAPETRDVLLRRQVAQVALAQVRKQDAAWHPDQRDCAGLIRFAFRAAYKQHAPERLATPLWADERGRPSDFADAETLLRHSFRPLGRDDATRESLRTQGWAWAVRDDVELAERRIARGPAGLERYQSEHLLDLVVRAQANIDRAMRAMEIPYEPEA